MKDAFGRSIEYVRLSLTDRCNLRCVYCMPPEGVASLPHDEILRVEEFARLIRIIAPLGVKHIRLTGGEPLVRKGIVDLVKKAKQTPGIESVALTTNALLLPRFGNELKRAGLDRVNISLDSLDHDEYRRITRCGCLDDALAGIDAALKLGFDPVKINVVAMRDASQDYWSFAKLTLDSPLHVRFIEYMPVGGETFASSWERERVVSAEEILGQIDDHARDHGIGPLLPTDEEPLGLGPARYYRLPGAQGTIGVISALSNHFCSSCNRMRVTSDGKLRPCLFSDEEYELKNALRTGTDEEVARLFLRAVHGKPQDHHDRVGTRRTMSQVGG